MDHPLAINVATNDDAQVISTMLARAFDDDPVSSYIFSNEARRPAGLRAFFTFIQHSQYTRFGHVLTTSDHRAAGIWGPPGMATPQTLRALLAMAPLVRWLGVTGTRRALSYLQATETAHMQAPHYYLAVLGTDPVVQGQGRGSALMAHMVETMDRRGYPAYLECSKESNISFYERFGFGVASELSRNGGPTVWTMDRPSC